MMRLLFPEPLERSRAVTPDERSLWRLAMRDAEPMPGRSLEAEADIEPAPAPAPPPLILKPAALVPAPLPVRSKTKPALPPLEPGATPGIDRRTDERLRRGRLGIDGCVDLHGMTQAEAHGALTTFIHRGWREGRRCLLVITGKGAFSPTGGILRHAVPRWLDDASLRPMIVAVHRAQPKDGGDGALYVLIRRRREAP